MKKLTVGAIVQTRNCSSERNGIS